MTPTQAPESCPFCGAGRVLIERPIGELVDFSCGSSWSDGYEYPRELQDDSCATAERERLTRERDGALARVKRLEEAGDKAVRNSYYPDRLAVWNEAKEAKP